MLSPLQLKHRLRLSLILLSVATQTDIEIHRSSTTNVRVQTNEIKEDHLCIGNNDRKFAPLVAKHGGVFNK